MDKRRNAERERDKKEIGKVSNIEKRGERERGREMANQKDHLLLLGDSRQTVV